MPTRDAPPLEMADEEIVWLHLAAGEQTLLRRYHNVRNCKVHEGSIVIPTTYKLIRHTGLTLCHWCRYRSIWGKELGQ